MHALQGHSWSIDWPGLSLFCRADSHTIDVSEATQLRCFLTLAAASLGATTGILYDICCSLYLHPASLFAPQVLPFIL
ncbi:hypothetical protein F4824DRAFT_449286, partial [Ustulina deusta]